jgi:hypothetical protein
MNLEGATVVLRARSVPEVLELALRWGVTVCRRTFFRLALVTLVPAFAACLIARLALEWEWAAVWALALCLATVCQGVFTVAAGDLVFDPDTRARGVLKRTVKRLPAYLVALLLTRLAMAVGTLIGGVGLFLVWPRVAFVHEAVLLEGGGKPLKRAQQLTRGRNERALGLVLAQALSLVAGALLTDALGNALLDDVLQLGRPLGELKDGGSVFALLGFFLAVPYTAACRLLLYIDTRTRQDGWDLQVRFQRAATAIAAEARP